MKKENTDATFGEIGKLLGKKWKEISASDKSKYEEMAKKDKVRACSGVPWWLCLSLALHCKQAHHCECFPPQCTRCCT